MHTRYKVCDENRKRLGLLFDMCQVELELKGKTEDDLRVNKSGIEKAIKNADKAVDVYGKYIWRK